MLPQAQTHDAAGGGACAGASYSFLTVLPFLGN